MIFRTPAEDEMDLTCKTKWNRLERMDENERNCLFALSVEDLRNNKDRENN